MASTPSIVVVGSYIQDLSFRCPTFPIGGQTLLGTFASRAGGKGSNQTIAAGRAGASAAFVGAIGDDAFAQVAKSFYQKEKLTAHWAIKKGQVTGAAAVLVDDSGQNVIVVSMGANEVLAPKDIPKGLIEKAKVVVTQCETDLATTQEALKRGWNAGTLTVLNPAPMREDFDPAILKFVDILIPNESEFAGLVVRAGLRKQLHQNSVASLADKELQRLCRGLGVPTVIVTLGSAGVFLSQADSGHRYPALQGIPVVDTTGAGDAFVGGFAAGLVHFDGDLAKSVRFGITVAGLAVTKAGTSDAMPTQRELTTFLRKARKV